MAPAPKEALILDQTRPPTSRVVKCPGCPLELSENDMAAQRAHMDTQHPEIVAKRLAEVERLRGWAND
ncbi:MAG: hypothetical protein A3B23_02055 [Candidatus Colwellbacteria bacterium RIFCSPLOWO2_01_FULL_48_10]|uniref:DUF1059 domain-containing protein n=2 Tax=Bacteria candidate phyla TaxID=1783234 RepID=A0A1F5P1G1_9BACT|nr:MAG: hypothetical protein A2846_04435 [Candidatus Doudnabacteria bacterium RIFCSPHIGHO2_01_FULL_49_9]OGY59120.1 MAG: hypothetical protein A3B23_02055 [Candidatus Colwellbacteria bacterium RIFCSPLOWO2_01_FULL_48_10]